MDNKNEFEEFAPWLVLVITMIGGGLRALLLANKGLWLEEAFSMWLANHSVGDMLHWIANIDHNPPLYYLLLHYWIEINGNTPFGVRLLSAFFGTATIPVIYLIGKRLSGVVVGLVAAVLLALSPFNIRFAQETGMYTLLTFNAAIAIYALARLLTDPRSARPIGSQFREYMHAWRTLGPFESSPDAGFSYKDETRNQARWRAWISRHRWSPIQTIETDLAWVALIVFSAATMLSHNAGVLFPLAINIIILGLMLFRKIKKAGAQPTFEAPTFWNWMKAQAAIFLLWSPWIVAFIRQARTIYQEFWIPRPGWDSVIQVFKSFLNETSLATGGVVLVIWILYAVVLCFGLVHYLKKFSQFLFLAVLFAIPFLVELLVSIRRPIFLDRTLIWTTIPLFLLLAAGIAQLRFRLLIFVVLGIFATNNLFSTGDYFRFTQKEDWADPAGFIAKYVTNDDLILFNTTIAQLPFDYYFQPFEEQYLIQVEKHGVPDDMFASRTLEPRMTESDVPRLISLLSGHKTVWLVYSHNDYTDPGGLIPQTLASAMKLIFKRDYYGVQVYIYGAP